MYVVVLLGLITAMSVLWTYWIESRLQLDTEILPEGFQSTRHEIAKFLRLKEGNFPENEVRKTYREKSGTVRMPRPVREYTVTTNEKVANKITELRLLQRLKEVNIVLTYVNVFMKANSVQCTSVHMEQYNFSFIGSVLLHHTCFVLSVMKFLLHCNHYKAYVGKPFMNPFMERLDKLFS